MRAAREAQLPASIAAFCRFLRQGGLKVGSAEIIKAITAVELVGVSRKDDFKQALKSTLVTHREAVSLFDWAFELFWRNPADTRKVAAHLKRLAARRDRPPPSRDLRQWRRAAAELRTSPSGGDRLAESTERVEELPLYSRAEILKSKRFEDYTDEEQREVQQLMARNSWALGARLTRRLTPGHRRYRLSVRKTIRRSVLHTSELIPLAWQHRRKKPRPIVILCDISGSMERSTRMLLHYAHALTTHSRRAEVFTFGTRLTRISHLLRHRNANEALELLSADVKDWSGGTRIGETLRSFNVHWARRTLGGGAQVIIISDGWDTGDRDLLEKEIARLHRSCHRLIWLNPNLGHDGYQPITQGIETVLPHLDDFLPVHNLRSLFELGRRLDRPRAWPASLGMPLTQEIPGQD